MTIKGIYQGGVVVLLEGVTLPEGTEVVVAPDSTERNGSVEPDVKTSIGQAMAELARWAEQQPGELPSDLAENHDHYLHGLPKRS